MRLKQINMIWESRQAIRFICEIVKKNRIVCIRKSLDGRTEERFGRLINLETSLHLCNHILQKETTVTALRSGLH